MKNLHAPILITAALLLVLFFGSGLGGNLIKQVFRLIPGETETSAIMNAGIIIAVATSVVLFLQGLREGKTGNDPDHGSDI